MWKTGLNQGACFKLQDGLTFEVPITNAQPLITPLAISSLSHISAVNFL